MGMRPVHISPGVAQGGARKPAWMPTSRVRTSRQRRPSCPMRARASSRRLPFSTPLVTRGIGMSRWMRYTRTHGGTSASSRATCHPHTALSAPARSLCASYRSMVLSYGLSLQGLLPSGALISTQPGPMRDLPTTSITSHSCSETCLKWALAEREG